MRERVVLVPGSDRYHKPHKHSVNKPACQVTHRGNWTWRADASGKPCRHEGCFGGPY